MSSAGDAKPSQRCCLGLLYYSQALQEQGKRPVCLGLPHTPSEPVHIEDHKQLSDASDFKFVCLGHSLYDRASASSSQQQSTSGRTGSSDAPGRGSLPYCEGLEVILGRATQGATAGAVPAATAGPVAAAVAGERPPDELSAVLSDMLGGDESPIVKGAAKFSKIAARNWERMKSTANQAYNVTLKPLIDKLSGDQ